MRRGDPSTDALRSPPRVSKSSRRDFLLRRLKGLHFLVFDVDGGRDVRASWDASHVRVRVDNDPVLL